jgi:hypothetical protein
VTIVFPLYLDYFIPYVFALFFERRNFMMSAVNPPADTTLPATSAALAKQTGHTGPPLLL